MDKGTIEQLNNAAHDVAMTSGSLRGAASQQVENAVADVLRKDVETLLAVSSVLSDVRLAVQNEVMTPNAVCWSTSTPEFGPKSYFILIKEDNGTQIPLEVKWDAAQCKVTADVYRPEDYDYTIHDACDHEDGVCIEDSPEFQEDFQRDAELRRMGYKEAQRGNE